MREEEVRHIIQCWGNHKDLTDSAIDNFARVWCQRHPGEPTREQIVNLLHGFAVELWNRRDKVYRTAFSNSFSKVSRCINEICGKEQDMQEYNKIGMTGEKNDEYSQNAKTCLQGNAIAPSKREELEKILEEFWYDNCDTDAAGYDLPNAYKAFRVYMQDRIDSLFTPPEPPTDANGEIDWSQVPVGTDVECHKMWNKYCGECREDGKILLRYGKSKNHWYYAYTEDCRIIDPTTEIRRLQDDM